MKLVLVRHGRTEWNKNEIFRGRADIPLDRVGAKQADAIAEMLKHFNVWKVYTSPLVRASGTALKIGKKSRAPVILESALIDLDYGKWQGLSLRQVKRQHPKPYKRWIDKPQLFQFPSGESLASVRLRAASFINKILSKPSSRDVAIVSHRIIAKLIVLHLLSLDNSYFWKFKLDVGSVSVFDCGENTPVLQTLNDISHLGNALTPVGKDF